MQFVLIYSSPLSNIWKIEVPNSSVYVYKEFLGANSESSESSLEMSFHHSMSGIPGVVPLVKDPDYEATPRVLLMEFCQEGSLQSYIQNRGGILAEEELLSMYRSMVRTIRQILEKRVVHRVLTCTNWLITSDSKVKLSDFGHAKFIPCDQSQFPNSLKNDKGEITGHSKRIFAEELRHLANVFFQMAVGNFDTQVAKMRPSQIDAACSNRGYNWHVASSIKYLLRVQANRQEDVGKYLEELEEQQTTSVEIEDLEEFEIFCNLCSDKIASVSFGGCPHHFCANCWQLHGVAREETNCLICSKNTYSQEAAALEEAS